jgi:hypothetical protein
MFSPITPKVYKRARRIRLKDIKFMRISQAYFPVYGQYKIRQKMNFRHTKKNIDSRSPSWRQDRMGKKPYHVTVPLKCLTSPRKSRFNYGTEETLTFSVIIKVSRRPMSLIILLQQNIHT